MTPRKKTDIKNIKEINEGLIYDAKFTVAFTYSAV